MPQFFQTYGLLIMMLVLFGAMIWFSGRSRKKYQAQREAELEDFRTNLKPGQWVRTRWGFWGRYVDRDGDVVILETPNGTETYWELNVIASTGEPPFADDSESEDDLPVDTESVLGLDSTSPASSRLETSEQTPDDSQQESDSDSTKTDPSTK